MSEEISKLFKFVKEWLPILSLLVAFGLWVDTRYMHIDSAHQIKAATDRVHLELQMGLLSSQIRDYHTIENPTEEEKLQYELDKDQLKWLMSERNRLLGLTGDDQ